MRIRPFLRQCICAKLVTADDSRINKSVKCTELRKQQAIRFVPKIFYNFLQLKLKKMSDNITYIPGKRLLRSNSVFPRSGKPNNEKQNPPERPLQPKRSSFNENGIPAKPAKKRGKITKADSCCALAETVSHLDLQICKQNDELVLSKNQLVDLQNKHIKAMEINFIRNEKANERQKQMEDEISFLKGELNKIRSQQFVQDLIVFDDDRGNKKCSGFLFGH